ncbi:major histocompatibility complex class I-related gene protein-like isoform X2 [Mastacembelus armatus]|uniref:major histocompatibility complex class I-related gene protein-like isoform X2 n=1 Tax=Mastacembelus armatus TaxID=205130 RepID=UPI000E463DE2|nr:major histocompatibility complex class I-related gene protein-like isoform X2 [Mastacembelus armatus]
MKHSLTYFLTASSGLQTFPEFVGVLMVDGVEMGYCDSDIKTVETRQDWVEKLKKKYPDEFDQHVEQCKVAHERTKSRIANINQHFNQTGGLHIFQEIDICEWDDETEEIDGHVLFGYDGEDFISLDVKSQTWQFKDMAATYQHKWDKDKARLKFYFILTTNICPEILNISLIYGSSSLQRTDLPSVSLLQKTPSSPVSCHATGFYPDKADLFWRKDGEQLHEDVDHGEILPNKDGTFQMRVDLKLSSVRPEDWSRYDCVFQLSGVKNHIVTKLDKDQIRTNWGGDPQFPVAAVIGAVVGLLLLAACISGLFIWRKKNNEVFQVSSQETIVNFHQTQVQVQCDHISDRSDTNVTVEENTPGATTSGEK